MTESALAYRAARERAALFELPGASLVELAGPERLEWLNTLVTNKVDDLEPGSAARAFLLSPTRGRVLADLLVCETGDRTWIECSGGSAPAVMEILTKYWLGRDVEFHDRAGEWWLGSLQGPEAPAILTGVVNDVPPAEEGTHEETTLAGREARVLRWSDTGLPGYHLWVPAATTPAARAAIVEAGALEGDPTAWKLLQIEGGVAAYGRELDEDVIPLEAPTENAIHHGKGCYPGQEVIARLWARGRPARRLVGLRFEGGPAPAAGTALDAEGKPAAATVTASGESPDLGPVALAYVHRDYCDPGTRLSVDGVSAVVVDLPMRREDGER
ncbi:MAG TPA: glycine cleavage T C-terminal barrel domain-containing protein [Gemmatimonadota bacterium]|nr:glycine cleavage T C-terminal barrel domain-containing protein [Gemmatimonadota bacterium]